MEKIIARPSVFMSALIPIPAVFCGAYAMFKMDLSPSVWMIHGVFVFIGLLVFASILAIRQMPGYAVDLLGWLCLLLLGSTLLASGMNGVHRWLQIGPIGLNVSAMTAPILLWVFASSKSRYKNVLMIAMQVIHSLQPDAGQAFSFAIASTCAVVARKGYRLKLNTLALFPLWGLTLYTFQKGDKLDAVPHVEEIMQIAVLMSPLLAVAIICSLGLIASWFTFYIQKVANNLTQAIYSRSLFAYLIASFCAPAIGTFPTPLFGYGASPIIGLYVGLALLHKF